MCCEYDVSFRRVKRPGRDVHHPLSSSAEVKESVELSYTSTSHLGLRGLFKGNI